LVSDDTPFWEQEDSNIAPAKESVKNVVEYLIPIGYLFQARYSA
jgi:hypothetical protein